jgi:hypothetical protein
MGTVRQCLIDLFVNKLSKNGCIDCQKNKKGNAYVLPYLIALTTIRFNKPAVRSRKIKAIICHSTTSFDDDHLKH